MHSPSSPSPRSGADELRDRWRALCAALGIAPGLSEPLGQRLIKAWQRWPRHYHAHSHLLACLRAADTVAPLMEQPDAVRWALWFHDAVYWPWSKVNERRSADWAREAALACGLPEAFAIRVDHLVMATAHGAPGSDLATGVDADLLVDIDLGVLGQPAPVYARYVQDVKREYFWVLPGAWRRGRARVLQHFAAQPRLYRTAHFRERLESAARANLEAELARLRAT